LSDQQAAAMLNEARLIIEHSPDYQRVCAEMISLLQQVALYQADPKLASEDEFGAEILQKYSRRWSPEEIQLYYQILLQGRQDLLISPDEAAGFEMLMLRLIAFSPRPDSELEAVEVKKKPDAIADSEKPDSEKPEAEQPEAEQPEAEKPEAEKPEAKNQVAEIAAPSKEVDSALGWSAMAYELGLTGLAQEIVANSLLLSHAGERIQLQLSTELLEFVNDVTRTEILQALEHKLGVSLRLELTATAELVGETPLQAKLRRQQQERLAAIAAIREEAMVKKLQHAFAAELDETTVVKIESNG